MNEEHFAADWAVLGPQRRIVVPASITSRLSWLGREGSEAASIQLIQQGRIILRPLSKVESVVHAARERFKEELGEVEASRRVAFSHHVFRKILPEGRAKRLKLRPSVLKHLSIIEGDEVFCLAYSDQLEIMSKEQYLRLFAEFGDEIIID